MSISRISSGNTSSFSGSYQAGDLITIVAINNSSSATPTTPSGYTLVANGSQSAALFAMTWIWKIAASGSETFPTITNGTQYAWAIYRGTASASAFVQAAGQASSSASTTISYSGIVSYQHPAADWTLAVGVSNNQLAGIGSVPPTSMVLPTNGEADGSGYDVAIFDSNGPLSSYSFNSKTLSFSSNWITKTAELVASSGSSSISKVAGVARASISKAEGVALASIGKVAGLA